MFYNLYRSTKSGREEAEKTKLSKVGESLMNPKERLLNFHKRKKLQDLLVSKFKEKYRIKQSDPILETEINKFLQG